jgi:hypothetical protein
MKKLLLAGVLGLGLAACGDSGGNDQAAGNGAEGTGAESNAAAPAGTETASAAFPRGARIVEEDGATWRIDADGTRVRLGDTDSRILVEDGVRYRVDPDGSRVRIDDRGVTLDVDLPDVDVGINEKGNPDVDVGDRDPDGGR